MRVSIAIATGCLQGAVGQRRVTLAFLASISRDFTRSNIISKTSVLWCGVLMGSNSPPRLWTERLQSGRPTPVNSLIPSSAAQARSPKYPGVRMEIGSHRCRRVTPSRSGIPRAEKLHGDSMQRTAALMPLRGVPTERNSQPPVQTEKSWFGTFELERLSEGFKHILPKLFPSPGFGKDVCSPLADSLITPFVCGTRGAVSCY